MSSRARNHTALAYAPQDDKLHPSVSPALARAFDGFFGPPARELAATASLGSAQDRKSVETLPPYQPREMQGSLPAYSVLGHY